ncbi:uncharacterized protein BDV14DRAFT_195032 [Aspergillus stella-maris]|uniref:uncharacterized protein n=1 Tax=Aspergillus stella-maris TaxID=1810926 RepID=UPI003CCD4F5E
MSDSFDKALTSALVLPSEDTAALKQLLKDCEPATFGKGQEDVHDPEYRNTGKMDPNKFATTFHPADFGIIENMNKILFPSVSTEMENSLGFRKLRVGLYKLNVYSGPSDLFRKHVDTPRSENQIGSLVVCLPSKFKGGKFKVQHAGQHSFDWSSKSDSTIQWAAFYSDCEHEIETFNEGERITLTYNIYVTEPVRVLSPSDNAIQLKSLPLYGGVLGSYCTHAYPHNTKLAKALPPRGLKDGDLMMYAVLQCLGVKVKVLPVLGKGREEEYQEEDEEDEDEDEHELREGKIVLDRVWKSYRAKHITWISDPKHAKLALTYITYGNEASIGTVYSHAAILAVIPPFDERKNLG